MAKESKWVTFNPNRVGTPDEELYKARRALAKQANQRMLRLERAVSPITGKSYAYGAYDVAQSYLPKDKKRFSEALGKTRGIDEIKREIIVLQNFLLSESSTVGGIRKIEKKRQETFLKKGLPSQVVNDPRFYAFLQSETFKQLSKSFTSGTPVDIIREKAEQEGEDFNLEETIKAFDNYLESTEVTSLKGLRKAAGVPLISK